MNQEYGANIDARQESGKDSLSETKKVHMDTGSIQPPTGIEEVLSEEIPQPEVAIPDSPESSQPDKPDEEDGTSIGNYDLVDIEEIEQNIRFDKSITSDAKVSDDEFILDLPPKINPSTPEAITSPSDDDVKWDSSRVNGYSQSSFDDIFVKALETGEWAQHVEFGDNKAKIKRAGMNMQSDRVLDPSSVVNMMKAYIGDGNIVQVPLLNSGFYVAIKPPSERDNILFLTSIVNDNIKLGRETYGAVYSADTGVLEKRVFNFIMQHIHSHSIKGNNINIRSLIKTSDLNLLKWGLVCAIYPKGHAYARACDFMPNKCRHVKEGMIDLFTMLFIKNNCFTDEQRAHMANYKTGSMSLADVKKYQEKTKGMVTEVPFNDTTLKLTLKDSFVDSYFNSSSDWIDMMASLAEDALGEDAEDNARNNLMTQMSESAALRKYAHLVEEISGDFGIIQHPDAISKALESLSHEPEIHKGFTKAFTDFLNSTNYVIGIDSYKCPSCGHQASKDYLIPIDVLEVFTSILGTRILRL